MSDEASSNLLLDPSQIKTQSDRDLVAARNVVNRIGGLPIAIAHIAGYITASSITLQELLSNLPTLDFNNIWSAGNSPSEYMYGKRLDMVWNIALEKLSEEARDQLYVFALLNPDSIPESMLLAQALPDKKSR